ncbi:MAG TPA: type II toxin-antitoxin system death-on-curing family toxin [Polyangiaceae bacterium]|nr:type II toxin-antitoxin system death-on-curing family toxin [Polyangiaceae bacterium]
MKYENVPFLTVDRVEEIHEQALSTGGGAGILNRSLLESAVHAARATFDGTPLYGSLAEVAAAYAYRIARNHAFVDGNKRTALLAAWTFLDTNGHLIPLDQSWVDLMVRVASDPRFDETELVEAFVARMRFDEPIE